MASPVTPDSTKALRPALVSVLHAEPERASARCTTRQLFEAHGGFVLRLVRRLGVRASDVEDVTQEVFMIAHRRIADLHGEEQARSWLFGIARRVVANHLRKSNRRREQPVTDMPVEASFDPAETLQLNRDRALLERALSRLDPDKRAVFVLFELEGLAMHEIAELVGCPLNTAYSRLYAGRALVQRHVLAPGGTR
jgi:RNA polymerase sigma-70 factor, ECF subfamily